MSLRRRQQPSTLTANAAAELLQAEARVALLDRARPENLAEERERLSAAWSRGEQPAPGLRYAPPPELGELRRRLESLAQLLSADGADLEQRLLSGRALELSLEASIVEHIGDPQLVRLAARRFVDGEPEARAISLSWANDGASDERAALPLHDTGDARDPQSLLSLLSARVGAERLAVRVELCAGLPALAAIGPGVLRIRSGARLSAQRARRIMIHEIEGHLLPRAAGARLGGVFAAGSQRALDDEEGRALLLEERAGTFDAERRAEIGRRYLAAESVRAGADFWETVRLLDSLGAAPGPSVELACRVHRGGGLGREIVYLGGYLRVRRALGERPELERYLQSGRLSAAAAAALADGSSDFEHDRALI